MKNGGLQVGPVAFRSCEEQAGGRGLCTLLTVDSSPGLPPTSFKKKGLLPTAGATFQREAGAGLDA
jgi:hypothetical protein